MKKKYILLLIVLIMAIKANSALAVDFYPELGLDPFYSSLNPAYINNDEMPEHQDSIVKIIKNKRDEKKANKELKANEKEEKKQLLINQKQQASLFEENDEDEIIEEQPRKHLTRKELEKELNAEEREKQAALKKQIKEQEKQNRNSFFSFKKKNNVVTEQFEPLKDPDVIFTADYMEYFPERYEVEAIGDAKIVFKKTGATLFANKIIFNYDRNIIKANENVILKTDESVTEGDYVKIDLNKADGWIESPLTTLEDIHLSAKEAYIYSDKIEEYDGVAKILKDETLSFGARSFSAYVDQGRVLQNNTNLDKSEKGLYKLKANLIEIDAKDDHEIITIKDADLYIKNHKIAKVPSVKVVTNKEHASVETNLPEFGSQSMLGMHVGPAVVLNVPGGSTLKLAPILTYKDSNLGFGAIARFRNEHNMTEMAYGSSKDELLIRGRHKLAPGLLLNYSRYTNQNEWFLGYRMPKYSTQLSYARSDYIKDLKLNFSQLYSGGVFIDNRQGVKSRDAEMRFRWMTQTFKSFYDYQNDEGSVSLNFGLVAQTASTVYTSGDTIGLVRVGPVLSTQVGPWKQSMMYYQTGQAGRSPFYFDSYRYGRSNIVLVESLKVCKFLNLGYLASLAMDREYKNDDLFQENRFLVSIGPDYAKVTIGYDAYRKNTMFVFSMLVGTKNSDVEYKKAIVKNPDKFGKSDKKSKKKKNKKKSYKKYLKQPVVVQ